MRPPFSEFSSQFLYIKQQSNDHVSISRSTKELNYHIEII